MWLAMAVVLATGSAIQSAIGFAFGLFVVPTLLLMGLQPYEAIVTVGVCAFIQTASALWKHRTQVPWRGVLPFAAIGIATQPIGVWLLGRLVAFEPTTIRQVFGCILLVVIAGQGWFRPRPRERLHVGWGILAFATAGLLTGLSGMGGPPLVLWVMAHDWSSRRSRITLWMIFLSMLPSNLGFQGIRFGDEAWIAMGRAVCFLPIVLVGAIPGHWIGQQLPKATLRRVAMGVLILIAAYAILEPMLHG